MATTRQETAVVLYYAIGMSHREIGMALGCSKQASHTLVKRAVDSLVREAVDAGVDAHALVGRLIGLSDSAGSKTRHLGRALTRQEELADTLELHLQQRADELAMYEQWIEADSHLPSHTKRNPYDQWELRYLKGKKGEPLPTSAYRADNAAAHCAADRDRCGLDCAGCGRQGGEG